MAENENVLALENLADDGQRILHVKNLVYAVEESSKDSRKIH